MVISTVSGLANGRMYTGCLSGLLQFRRYLLTRMVFCGCCCVHAGCWTWNGMQLTNL